MVAKRSRVQLEPSVDALLMKRIDSARDMLKIHLGVAERLSRQLIVQVGAAEVTGFPFELEQLEYLDDRFKGLAADVAVARAYLHEILALKRFEYLDTK